MTRITLLTSLVIGFFLFPSFSLFSQCSATDITDPVIICPMNFSELSCSDVIQTGATSVVEFNSLDAVSMATDDCGIESISFLDDLDPTTFSFCAADGPFIVTRTYTVIDTAGNQASCAQTFSFVADTENPVVTNPGNITAAQGLVCEDDFNPFSLHTAFGEGLPNILDNCSGALDAATLAADPSIMSGFDPGIEVVVGNFTISYTDNIIVHPLGICTDPNQRKFRIIRTWTVADACGNIGNVNQNINAGDNFTPPVPGIVAGTLNFSTDELCETTILASDIEDGSTDNCGENSLDPSTYDVSASALIRIEGLGGTFEPSLTLTTADFDFSVACPFPLNIELLVTDECGNSATTIKEVFIVDTIKPLIISCPNDTTIFGCSENDIMAPVFPYSAVDVEISEIEFVAAMGEVSDACGIKSIFYRDSIDATEIGCPNPINRILRSFTITDNCDNDTVCVQNFFFVDTLPPSIVCPMDTVLNTSSDSIGNCTTTVAGIELSATDACNYDITITYTLTGATTGSGTGDAGLTNFELGITEVKYFAADCAGNVDSCTFMVEVLDDEAPVLNCPSDFTVSTDVDVCEAVIDYIITATDNCSSFSRTRLTLLNGVDSAGIFPIGSTLVEFSYEDESGNVDNCSFNVLVEDNQAPELICAPNITINLDNLACDTVVVFADPIVTDNCMSPISVVRIDVTGLNSNDAFPIGSTDIIYEATDAAGNKDTCTFNVLVIEAANSNVACITNINVSIDETCSGNLTPRMLLLGNDYGCLDNWTVTVFDENGNELPNAFDGSDIGKSYTYVVSSVDNDCEGIVNIEDKFPPQITCTSDTITCGQLIVFPDPIITENCSGAVLKLLNETITPVACSNPDIQQIITKTWQAVDAAGNVSNTCEQELSISKFDIGTVDPPLNQNVALQCGVPFPTDNNGNPDPIVYGSPRLSGVNLWPQQYLICNLMVNYSDLTLQTSQNTTSIVRTWTATTWVCGVDSTRQFVQVFTISDTEGPQMTCPSDMTLNTAGINCVATITLPAITINDLCGTVTRVDVDYEGGFLQNSNGGTVEIPSGNSQVTYIAYDNNGNSNSCSFNVTVGDLEQPIPVCEQFTVVTLTNNGTAIVDASVFDDGSFDACGTVTLQVRRMTPSCDPNDITFGESVTFCCADLNVEQMVVLRITDQNGNYNECMVTANVQDKIPPILVQGLPDITLSCEFPFNTADTEQFGSIVMDVDDREDILLTAELVQFSGEAKDGLVLGNCVELLTDEITFSNISSCGTGSATRILTFTNGQGLTVADVQIITFVNPSPFVESDIDFPDDISFTNICDLDLVLPENLPASFSVPVYTEDGCDQVGINYEDQVIDNSNGSLSCVQIIRTWTLVDWCQNVNGQFVTFEGQQVINITNTIDPVITGDCSNREVCSFDPNCGPVYIELTNSGTDDCTSEAFLNWSYTIDLFSDSTIDIVGNTTVASGTYPVGLHTITWNLNDACGNDAVCSYTFHLKNCKTATPVCLDNLTTELGPIDTDGDNLPDTEEVTINASFFDGGSYHVCGTTVLLSFSANILDTTRTFGCCDLGLQPIELWVTDENGNQDFCTTSLDVQNNIDEGICPACASIDIVGELKTEDSEMISEGIVTLKGGEAVDMTDNDGQYEFLDMPKGGSYLVSPVKDNNFVNGITTLDIILIQKHILGLQNLDSPYKLIAADINNNGSISGADIIQLRKLILGHYAEFPNNTSWKFIDANFNFIDDNDPWSSTMTEEYEILDLQKDMVINFIGMKIGDVNNSASPNQFTDNQIDIRSNDALEFVIHSDNLVPNESVWLPVHAANFDQLLGFQFSGAFAQNVSILDVRSAALDLDDSNFRITNNSILSMVWHELQAQTFRPEEVLFEIEVKVTGTMATDQILTVNDYYLTSESYDAQTQTSKVEFTTRSTTVATENNQINNFELAQNEPNPWITSTVISVESPITGEAEISVMNLDGKILLTKNVTFAKGNNDIILTNADLSQSGVLYYEVKMGETRMMKKMVLIK